MPRRSPAPLLALAAALAAAAAPSPARADQRSYAFTYQPLTAPKGGLELETFTTLAAPRAGSPQGRTWQEQVELEYGLTDRWDVAVYGVFERPFGGSLEAEAVKVESRYRLTEPGTSLLDAVAYLELERSFPDGGGTAIEEKLIVGKDFGRFNVAANVWAEQERVHETVLNVGWSAGASWEFSPAFRLGAEGFGEIDDATSSTGRQSGAWAGPSIGVSLPLRGGPLRGTWAAVTAGFGLTRESDDLRIRGILAFQF
jgi:hypothetical protein